MQYQELLHNSNSLRPRRNLEAWFSKRGDEDQFRGQGRREQDGDTGAQQGSARHHQARRLAPVLEFQGVAGGRLEPGQHEPMQRFTVSCATEREQPCMPLRRT